MALILSFRQYRLHDRYLENADIDPVGVFCTDGLFSPFRREDEDIRLDNMVFNFRGKSEFVFHLLLTCVEFLTSFYVFV